MITLSILVGDGFKPTHFQDTKLFGMYKPIKSLLVNYLKRIIKRTKINCILFTCLVKDKLRTLLNTLQVDSLEEEKANSLALKMKLFYDSCNSLVHINIDGPKNLKRAITELGGWNVLRDFQTNDFDFNRVLRKVQGEYRVSPFFKISVVPDIVGPSRNIIKVCFFLN
jgi:hypothetical protein